MLFIRRCASSIVIVFQVRLSSDHTKIVQHATVPASKQSTTIYGLTPGQEYIFNVAAVLKPPAEIQARSGTVAPTPTGVTISDVTDTGFQVSWNEMPKVKVRQALVVRRYWDDC